MLIAHLKRKSRNDYSATEKNETNKLKETNFLHISEKTETESELFFLFLKISCFKK